MSKLTNKKPSKLKFKPKRKQLELKPDFPRAKSFRPLRPTARVLRQNIAKGGVMARAKSIEFKNQKLKKYVGMPLAAHIDIIHIENSDTAYVLAESATWLQRAKFMHEDILKLLNQLSIKPIENLQFKVKRT